MLSLFSRLRQNNQNKIIILLFHRVGRTRCHAFGPMSATFMISDFEKVISSISEHYQVISLDDALEQLSDGIDKNTIVITFDDGYQDTYTEALPVLEKYQVPATVYITSGFIRRNKYPYEFQLAEVIAKNENFEYELNGNVYTGDLENISDKRTFYIKLKDQFRPLLDEERMLILEQLAKGELQQYTDDQLFMNWSQVKELSQHSLITIGAHTLSHMQLDLVSDDIATIDIQQGTTDLERELGIIIEHFAYPYGGYSQSVIELVSDNKFKSAVTTKPDYIDCNKKINKLKLPRVELAHQNIMSELDRLHAMFAA